MLNACDNNILHSVLLFFRVRFGLKLKRLLIECNKFLKKPCWHSKQRSKLAVNRLVSHVGARGILFEPCCTHNKDTNKTKKFPISTVLPQLPPLSVFKSLHYSCMAVSVRPTWPPPFVTWTPPPHYAFSCSFQALPH